MKHFLRLSILLLSLQILIITNANAQESAKEPTQLFRVFFDDDYFNYSGHGTDRAYTAGSRLEVFHRENKPSHFFLDRVMPKAGDSSINVLGWGISQLMITPDNISRADFQPDDYPWSGALFATHTLYSYNEQKKYDLQTELDLGILGPAALAGETQDHVHQMIRYRRPMGWKNQFGNSPYVDISLTGEKQLLGLQGLIEVIGGGQVVVGTGMNAAAVYSLIRIGKMTPYFKGFLKQYSSIGSRKKVQFYFIFKPQMQYQLTNALFEGGLFSSKPRMVVKEPIKNTQSETYHPLNPVLYSFTFGPALVINHFYNLFHPN